MNANESSPDQFTNSASTEVRMLKEMMLIRRMEQRSLELSHAESPPIIGSIHLCAGQEAVPVGAAAALQSDDQIVATYRGHGWAIASGLTINEVLGEICQRQLGINGGRGGSAYMMAPHRRFIGENSIVGAGVPIACGVAMANERLSTGKLVIVSIGDGALNQGAVHEGMAFAVARKLPLIIICENNDWSEMTPTSEMFKIPQLSQRVVAYGMAGVTIDGTDPVVVRDTIKRIAERVRAGDGPALIECKVPRLWGHYNRDIEHYRPTTDRRDAATRDPIETFSKKLINVGLLDVDQFAALNTAVNAQIEAAEREVLASNAPDGDSARDHVWSRQQQPAAISSVTSVETKKMTYIQAVNEALRRELASRPNVLVYGEDVGKAGGIFGAARYLQKNFGAERVFDTPIAESAILGSAVGASMMGLKPIVEIMWADFMLVALDQLINQAANIRYITQGRCGAPLVVRTQQGATPGSCAQHSQSLEALLLHIPGLRVATPATPQDAYDILRAATAADDPCVIFESRALYPLSAEVTLSDTIQPIGKARIHRQGRDALIVTWGTSLRMSLEAAEALAADGIDAGVIDLRWLCPLDEEQLYAAVRSASGSVVIVHEANTTAGFGAEIAARLYEKLGEEMQLKVARVGSPDIRMPAAPALQRALLPNTDRVVAAVRGVLKAQMSVAAGARG